MYKTSIDGGYTWSDPVDITLQVHRPKQTAYDSNYSFAEDWRYYANTPGHAIQMNSGKYKDRIFVAANHSVGEPQKNAMHYVAHGYFTEDHGKTFVLGNSISLAGSNESMAVELSNNRLLMNSRNQRGDVRARIVSLSSDGGASWDTTYFDKQLIDPVCQGSILDIGKRKGKNILAFCNASDVKSRNHLTLQISFDEGVSWQKRINIYSGADAASGKFDFAAYSDLIKMGARHIGILYEKDNYSKISFAIVKWK